jgi:hypothetical protein
MEMYRVPGVFKTKYGCDRGVIITKSRYLADGSPYWEIQTAFGEPLMIPTVCLENLSPAPGNVFIKTWSENQGVWEELKRLGIVGDPVRIIEVGSFGAEAYECPILMEELK